MLFPAIITALATLAAAASSSYSRNANVTQNSVTIKANVAELGQNASYKSTIVKIAHLTTFHDLYARELFLGSTNSTSFEIANVECRAYKDTAGLQPGSTVFAANQPAEVSTQLVTIGSVLCYVTEDS